MALKAWRIASPGFLGVMISHCDFWTAVRDLRSSVCRRCSGLISILNVSCCPEGDVTLILYTSAVMLPTYWFSVWWCFWGAPVASVSISCPSCSATDGVVRNGKSTAGHQRYLCSHCRKTWQLQFTYTASQPGTHQKIIDMAMNGVGCRATARIMGVGLNTILRHLKNSGRSR